MKKDDYKTRRIREAGFGGYGTVQSQQFAGAGSGFYRKDLVDASLNPLFTVILPTLKGTVGTIEFAIFATDNTDVQIRRGLIQYSVVNKGGVYISEIVVINEGISTSSGTLTAIWSITTQANQITINITPTGSLTETTYFIQYVVINISDQFLSPI